MAEKIRHPRLFQAFSWGLLLLGWVLLLGLARDVPLKNGIPLLVFIPLVLAADRFAVRMPGNVYLSLETTFHLACALIFGPLTAAWLAGIATFISELFLFRRRVHYAARTTGMYILMWLAGGAAYRAVGGTAPLMRLDGPNIGRAFLLFLTATAVNYAIMTVDSLIRGIPLTQFLFQVSPRIVLFKTAFAPFGILGAILHTSIGAGASLLLAICFLAGLVTVWQLQQTSEQLRRQVITLNLMNEIGQMLSSSLDLGRLLNLIYEGASRLMDTTNFWIVLYDEEHNEVRYELLYDEGHPYPPEAVPYDPRRYLAAYTIARAEPVFLSTPEEVRQVPIYLETTGSGRWPESLIAVPILSKGRAIGAISVQSYEPRTFKPEDVETLMALARQAGIALENARLFQEVDASQRYLRAILDSVDYAVLVTDLDGRVRLVNRAVENVFGLRGSDALNRPLREVVQHQSLREVVERIGRGEVRVRESIQVVLSDDRIMSAQVAPISDARGERIGYVLAMADVTALHRLSQLKSQVIRIASHDLRNPLQLAGGFFQILLEELPPLTKMQEDLAGRVLHHLNAMERLIDELLELERIEVPEGRLRELVDMGQLVQQVVNEYRWQAEAKGLRLWTELSRGVSPVEGDRRMLCQAVGNLLDNAIKYTPEGGSITVRLWQEDGEVMLSVKDTGLGIPSEALPHIFEHFYRARQPGTEHISGTGLGLSLVQSIVHDHRGRVWAESEGIPGKGSTFYIALPSAQSCQVP